MRWRRDAGFHLLLAGTAGEVSPMLMLMRDFTRYRKHLRDNLRLLAIPAEPASAPELESQPLSDRGGKQIR